MPGMAEGVREPLLNTPAGTIGLFYTELADVGGELTTRFRIHTDFFRKRGMFFDSVAGQDHNARVRGTINLGFTPWKYLELFLAIRSAANRNDREQLGRQDPVGVFALGDTSFGIKAAHRFKRGGIGVGGVLGVGLLAGNDRLLSERIDFRVDALFTLDARYLTRRQVPVRFSTNVGYMLDNSLALLNWSAFTDSVSREVTRFALGVNHDRVRTRHALDFPIRFGKQQQFGLDPIVEFVWEVATERAGAFAIPTATPSPLPRSTQWIAMGLRANVIRGLQLDVAADVGLMSPNFEYGPPVHPWQIMLGLGWSFELARPSKVEDAPTKPPPPTATVGRIVGRVVALDGTPVPEAVVRFPQRPTSGLVADGSGAFTSYELSAGEHRVQVFVAGAVALETSVRVVGGSDTQVELRLERELVPPTGIVEGAFTDAAGTPVQVSVQIRGEGIDESFQSDASGRIALELYAGEYRATVAAPGHVAASLSLVVQAEQTVVVDAKLERDAPPPTPNVRVAGRRLILRHGVRFDKDGLDPRTRAELDELALFLQHHVEYERIEIRVHTDDRGNPKRRSSERAEAVRAYLVEKGVASERLTAVGYGARAPVAVNLTPSGRAQNNRVEFRIAQQRP